MSQAGPGTWSQLIHLHAGLHPPHKGLRPPKGSGRPLMVTPNRITRWSAPTINTRTHTH